MGDVGEQGQVGVRTVGMVGRWDGESDLGQTLTEVKGVSIPDWQKG